MSFHQLISNGHRLRVLPIFLGQWVYPDDLIVHILHSAHPRLSSLLVPVLDRAAWLDNFVGRHGGIANKHNFVIVAVLVQDIQNLRAFIMAPNVISPDTLVQKNCGSKKLFKCLNSVRAAENNSSQTFTCGSMEPPTSRNSNTFTAL